MFCDVTKDDLKTIRDNFNETYKRLRLLEERISCLESGKPLLCLNKEDGLYCDCSLCVRFNGLPPARV